LRKGIKENPKPILKVHVREGIKENPKPILKRLKKLKKNQKLTRGVDFNTI